MNTRGGLTTSILRILTLLTMIGALFAVFIWVPTDAFQGIVQRIFYFHVSAAWLGFLAFFVVFICSILYLWKRERRWDVLAHSSAEIGTMFTTLVLLTGPLWGKPIWGTWWSWDPRLTTTLILWFIYIAYLMLRSYAEIGGRGERFAAVVGIVGFFDVPIVYVAVQLWRSLHPGPVILTGSGPGLAPVMLQTLFISLAAFTLLYLSLMIERVRLRQLEDEVEILKLSLAQ